MSLRTITKNRESIPSDESLAKLFYLTGIAPLGKLR
ncbi:MAG: hypothetical protein CVU60_08385 [Deltaproteobacteria bacterium HGW-Deltaproteobacteria-18]|jgi:hypothetical protein|nr:MAG: hypothetical protein CVU60_08385 [Deltaproteobacteria bacterium HGW-Deltaproteobacteria-18]